MSFDDAGAIGGYRPPAPPSPAAPQYALNGSFNGKPIVVGASARFGGAVYSLKCGGFEHLDSSDHGRELQSAWQYNNTGEAQNPTEAGSSANGAGQLSSSRILSASVSGATLKTRINPSYWYAYNGAIVSPDFFEKTVTLGHQGHSNVLVHECELYVGDPYNNFLSVEGLTAYTPVTFTRMFLVDRATSVPTEMIAPYTWTPSTDHYPLAATIDLTHAIALLHSRSDTMLGYWGGKASNLWPKLDAAWFRYSNPSGWYRWRVYTVFGSFQEVLDTASTL